MSGLTLQRRPGESVVIGAGSAVITVTIMDKRRVRIDAPRHVSIRRAELPAFKGMRASRGTADAGPVTPANGTAAESPPATEGLCYAACVAAAGLLTGHLPQTARARTLLNDAITGSVAQCACGRADCNTCQGEL